MSSILTERNSRQRDAYPDRIGELAVDVVGVGAIGHEVARLCAMVGVGQIHLWDFDKVEPVNYGVQGYGPSDLGRLKVFATEAYMLALNPDVTTYRHPRKCDGTGLSPVVFVCVDSLEARREIWKGAQEAGHAITLIDGRAGAEKVEVHTADVTDRHYTESLVGDAYQGRCTMRMTVHNAVIAAGLMFAQFSRWLRGLPMSKSVSFDILGGVLAVEE